MIYEIKKCIFDEKDKVTSLIKVKNIIKIIL